MEHYITLFDSNFLPQGLALHDSLRRHGGEVNLWVLCMDERAEQVLGNLGLPGLRTIALAEVEAQFPELLAVKPDRSRAEYCWTLTPFTPRLVFEREPAAARVTYVDADVYFLGDPEALFRGFEMSRKAVQITEHGYDPEYDHSAVSGRYCVQFITFMRNTAEEVRLHWQRQCIEWCFATPNAGRFGDQKYLDSWPKAFGDLVHVMEHPERLLAPWNTRRFPYSGAIAFHFHGLRLLAQGRTLLHSRYVVPAVVDEHIYLPYVDLLREKEALLDFPVIQSATPPAWRRILLAAWYMASRRWGEWRSIQAVVKR